MRRIYKIIGGMLVTGVLIAGIGSGVAFAEYSSFEYGGEMVLAGSERFTKTLKYKVPAEETVIDVPVESAQDGMTETDQAMQEETDTELKTDEMSQEKAVVNLLIDYHYTVVEDTSIPKDEIHFVITYLSDNKNVHPEVSEGVIYSSEETSEYKYLYVDTDFQYNDFRDMMRVKEPILSDLKNHKISDYQLDKVEVIEIYVNPEAAFIMNVNNSDVF